MFLNTNKKFAPVIVIGIISGVLSWDGNFEGGDIAASRRSYLGESPIDIWGAFSGFFYGNFPNFLFAWGAWLLLFHILCTLIGLFLVWKYLIRNKFGNFVYFNFLFFSYALFVFTSYLTRDSTMTALYILGIGLILAAKNARPRYLYIWFSSAILVISLSLSFRPWLFFASILPVLLMKKAIRYKSVAFFFSAILPFLFNQLSYETRYFNKVHPELQVVISDLAYMSCISTNTNIREEGTSLLNFISDTKYTNIEICGDFRLSTWQSVGKWQASSQELGISFEPFDSPSKVVISSELSEIKYNQIRSEYLKFIITNLKDYLQIKMIQASQVIVAGDTFGFRAFETSLSNINIKKIYFVPYDFLISFHVLSPLFVALFGFIFIFTRFKKLNLEVIYKNTNLLNGYLFVITWVFFTTIAYIGDNGRYTYLSTLVFLLLIILDVPKLEILRQDVKSEIDSEKYD